MTYAEGLAPTWPVTSTWEDADGVTGWTLSVSPPGVSEVFSSCARVHRRPWAACAGLQARWLG